MQGLLLVVAVAVAVALAAPPAGLLMHMPAALGQVRPRHPTLALERFKSLPLTVRCLFKNKYMFTR